MSLISFFGDFVAQNVDGLFIDDEIGCILKSSDYNVLNFEAPIKIPGAKPINKSGPNLCQPLTSSKWVEHNGFNVVSVANNHAFDYGEDSMEATKNSFKKAKVVGAGEWDEAYHILEIELDDKRIGILCLTHREFGTLYDHWDKSHSKGTAWLSHPFVKTLIIENKKRMDYLFLYIHAGIEYVDYPLPEYRDLYRSFIDCGVDAVVATHPHVPQGWEEWKGKPIFYSLGNFCFQTDHLKKMHWDESLCVTFSLERDEKMSYCVKYLEYDDTSNKIGINKSPSFASHIEQLCSILKQPDDYMNEINNACVELLPQYYGHFSHSGFANIHALKSIIKGFYDVLRHKPLFNKVHVINNLQCESHCPTIIRGLKQKYKNVEY